MTASPVPTWSKRQVVASALRPASQQIALVDVLDRVLDVGAVVDGDIVLRVADVDLVFVGLRLIVTSVARAEAARGGRLGAPGRATPEDREYLGRLSKELERLQANLPAVVDAATPKEAERGIGKLVLTLVELIRQLLEREALRRIDRGTLTRTEREKLGLTFEVLARKIEELKATFGIKEPLNLDLGPLGRLL